MLAACGWGCSLAACAGAGAGAEAGAGASSRTGFEAEVGRRAAARESRAQDAKLAVAAGRLAGGPVRAGSAAERLAEMWRRSVPDSRIIQKFIAKLVGFPVRIFAD